MSIILHRNIFRRKYSSVFNILSSVVRFRDRHWLKSTSNEPVFEVYMMCISVSLDPVPTAFVPPSIQFIMHQLLCIIIKIVFNAMYRQYCVTLTSCNTNVTPILGFSKLNMIERGRKFLCFPQGSLN